MASPACLDRTEFGQQRLKRWKAVVEGAPRELTLCSFMFSVFYSTPFAKWAIPIQHARSATRFRVGALKCVPFGTRIPGTQLIVNKKERKKYVAVSTIRRFVFPGTGGVKKHMR